MPCEGLPKWPAKRPALTARRFMCGKTAKSSRGSHKQDKMIHLLERRHNDRFTELLDKFMPAWRIHRDELNRAPLSHEMWSY